VRGGHSKFLCPEFWFNLVCWLQFIIQPWLKEPKNYFWGCGEGKFWVDFYVIVIDRAEIRWHLYNVPVKDLSKRVYKTLSKPCQNGSWIINWLITQQLSVQKYFYNDLQPKYFKIYIIHLIQQHHLDET
jgi:hypothetical protein